MTRRTLTSVLTVAALGMSACGEADSARQVQSHESVASTTAFLNGQVSFQDCTTSQQNKILQAAATANSQVNGDFKGDLLACLKEATISWDDGDYPEEIIRRLGENKLTNVRCDDLDDVLGHAPVNIWAETMTLDNEFVNTSTTFSLAGVFLHEVAHNKGYRHPPSNEPGLREYKYTVPDQVRTCSEHISTTILVPGLSIASPNGSMRRDNASRAGLAPVGASGGEPFGPDNCASSSFARRLDVRHVSSDVQGLRMGCATRDGNTVQTATAWRGGTGTERVHDCGVGSLMVGVYGRASSRVVAISPICSTVTELANGSSTSTRLPLWVPAGVTAEQEFERRCPVGMAVRQLRGRHGSSVNRLELVCDDYDSTWAPITSFAPRIGPANLGSRYLEMCPTRGAVHGLFGSSGSVIERIGAQCGEILRNGSTLAATSADEYALPGHGGDGGEEWEPDACPAGSVLVGIGSRSSTARGVIAVRGRCASITGWDSGSTTTTLLDRHGGSDGTQLESMCPSRQFVVGWQVETGFTQAFPDVETVTSLVPRCAPL